MAIPFLPAWNLQPTRPTFYDTDSATMLELAAKMHGAFNEMVNDYNQFAISVNNQMQMFIDSTEADQEAFQVGIRQEFQDFIDLVTMKINDFENNVDTLEKRLVEKINEEIKSGAISVTENYDPNTESLSIAVTGGVNND